MAHNDAMRLACLLASYDSDAPHVRYHTFDAESEGGRWDEGSQHYPDITPEMFASWLAGSHFGDCVGVPATCLRCYAEPIWHQAEWLTLRLRGEAAP
jgi:hypothetical protein